jgi:histidine ammonia-lyase
VFCRGNSGVRLALVQRLVDFINANVYPELPQIGSLGVGDLQPMAHLGLCLAGMPEGRAHFRGESGESPEILKKAGISPVEFPFAQREALSLLSGSTVVLAASIYAWYKAQHLLDLSDVALALSMEAFRGELDAFDLRIHEARHIAGQMETAQRIRLLLSGSELVSEHTRKHYEGDVPRVQDPVSFRASPQVHGAVRDALGYVETVLVREMNASTDNPLFFEDTEGRLESLSGGNFHGALLSYAMDLLGIVTTDLGVLSERRSARLLDPNMSYGLPYNLVLDAIGLNTGFALVQANATALVGEMRNLANPASTGSIPSKNNQEDHNSMGMGAARKALQILEHLEIVLAVELLCASQGIDIILKHLNFPSLGQGTQQLHLRIREDVPPMVTDCYTRQLLHKMLNLVTGHALSHLLISILNEPNPEISMIS